MDSPLSETSCGIPYRETGPNLLREQRKANNAEWQRRADEARESARMEALFDQYESQHYKAYVRTKEDE